MTKKFCDVCEKEVKAFHDFAGNIVEFGVSEVCNECWGLLNDLVEDLRGVQQKANKSVEDWKAKQLEKLKNG